MNEGLIPRRYAKALYKVALERGDGKQLFATMETLCGSFAQNPSLQQTVANPFVDDEKKKSLLFTAAGADAWKNPTFADFIKLLASNRRLPIARDTALAFMDIYRQANNIYPVKIVSAEPLPAEEKARLCSLIEKHLNGGTADYSFAVDTALIGGFTVSIGSQRLDASVENELKQLRLRLLSKI